MTKEWCIPPEQNAAFVCRMKDIFKTYKQVYDPSSPVICMDESNKQHEKATIKGTPAKPGKLELDWAKHIQEFVEVHYPDAKKIKLIVDNLNIHTGAALYELLEPAHARKIL